MERYSPQFWAAIKADYESGARSVKEIADYYSVTEGAVYAHRKKGGWKKKESALPPIPITVPEFEPAPPQGTSDTACRQRLAPRLSKLLERTVAEIELAAAEEKKDTDSMQRARDVRTLGTVMRLLSELENPQPQADPFRQTGESEQNEDLIRHEIAERLERLQNAGRTA